MAFPAVMEGIGGAATLAGGIVGAQGAEQQAGAQAAMYRYQAGVAQMNAQVAGVEADLATATGEVKAQQSGMQTREQVGQTRAAYGAGNIAGKTAGDVTQSLTAIGQQKQGIIRQTAAGQRYRLQVGQASDVAQAGADIAGAQTALAAGKIGAETSILGAVGSVASKWAQFSMGSGGSTPYNAGA